MPKLALAARAVETYGAIDVWINSAGVTLFAALEDGPFEQHQRVIRTIYATGAYLSISCAEGASQIARDTVERHTANTCLGRRTGHANTSSTDCGDDRRTQAV